MKFQEVTTAGHRCLHEHLHAALRLFLRHQPVGHKPREDRLCVFVGRVGVQGGHGVTHRSGAFYRHVELILIHANLSLFLLGELLLQGHSAARRCCHELRHGCAVVTTGNPAQGVFIGRFLVHIGAGLLHLHAGERVLVLRAL